MNQYCMYKGELVNAAPFSPDYQGSPHYVINVKATDGGVFKIVVNAASTQVGGDGDFNVYSYVDLHFSDPVTSKLDSISAGLHTTEFPKLDYWQDRSLLDLHRMRAIPYKSENGDRADINDILNEILTIDSSGRATSLPYDNGSGAPENRNFYAVTSSSTGSAFFSYQRRTDFMRRT